MSDIEKRVREIASANSGVGAWPLLEYLGYFVGALSFPIGLIMVLSAVIVPAVRSNQDLADAKMPDSWLKEIANTPGVSDKGLAFLASHVKKKGSVSAKDALKFLEIEKAESQADQERAESDKARSESGAQALLGRAKAQGVSFLDDATDVLATRVKFAGTVTSNSLRVAAKVIRPD